MSAMGNEPATKTLWPLERCPECGYLLTGLPDRGRCPECGSAYHPDQIVLYGWASGNFAGVQNSAWPRMVLRTLLPLFWVPFILVSFCRPAGPPGLWWTAAVIVITASIAFQLYQRGRLTAEGIPPAQLRLTPHGFAQRDGVGPVALRPWHPAMDVWLHRGHRDRYRLRIREYSFWLYVYDLADMEFAADANTARQIVHQIRAWQRSSPPASVAGTVGDS